MDRRKSIPRNSEPSIASKASVSESGSRASASSPHKPNKLSKTLKRMSTPKRENQQKDSRNKRTTYNTFSSSKDQLRQIEGDIDQKLKKQLEKMNQLTSVVQDNKTQMAKSAEKVGDNQQGQLLRFEKKEISEKLHAELTQRDAQIKMLKTQNSELKRKISTLEKENKEANQVIKNYKQNEPKLQLKISELQGKIDMVRPKSRASSAKKKKEKEEKSEKNDLYELQRKYDDSCAEIDNLKRLDSEMKNFIENKTNDLEKAQNEIKSLQIDLENERKKASELSSSRPSQMQLSEFNPSDTMSQGDIISELSNKKQPIPIKKLALKQVRFSMNVPNRKKESRSMKETNTPSRITDRERTLIDDLTKVNDRNRSLENDLQYLRQRIASLQKDLQNNAEEQIQKMIEEPDKDIQLRVIDASKTCKLTTFSFNEIKPLKSNQENSEKLPKPSIESGTSVTNMFRTDQPKPSFESSGSNLPEFSPSASEEKQKLLDQIYKYKLDVQTLNNDNIELQQEIDAIAKEAEEKDSKFSVLFGEMKQVHQAEITKLNEEVVELKKKHDEVLAQSIKTKMKMIEQIELISRRSEKSSKVKISKSRKGGKQQENSSMKSLPYNQSVASLDNEHPNFRNSVPANGVNLFSNSSAAKSDKDQENPYKITNKHLNNTQKIKL